MVKTEGSDSRVVSSPRYTCCGRSVAGSIPAWDKHLCDAIMLVLSLRACDLNVCETHRDIRIRLSRVGLEHLILLVDSKLTKKTNSIIVS